MSIDRLVAIIDECRRDGDYYFADLGKMIANSYGIAVSHGVDGSFWAYDVGAASKQLHVCNENMLRHKQKMIESGEWPSGT
jgi:hypothetical protein